MILMKIADKRKAGEILGRKGLSEKIIKLAEDISNSGGLKNAIIKGGQIAELIDACSYDGYWDEKANSGRMKQVDRFKYLIEQEINKGE